MEQIQIIIILVLALLSGATTLIGAGLAICCNKKTRFVVLGIGFAAGIMLAISVFELLPEAVAAVGKNYALIATLAGFLVLLLGDIVIPHTHLVHEKGKIGKFMKIGLLVTLGMILHDFPEGFAMANSYVLSPGLGVLVAISIAIHNIPEEFAICIPLVLTKKRGFFLKAAFLSALAEPMGALIGIIAINIAPSFTPIFLAFAAGAMIFVSIDELLPLARNYKRTDLFLVGIGLSLITYFVLSYLIG